MKDVLSKLEVYKDTEWRFEMSIVPVCNDCHFTADKGNSYNLLDYLHEDFREFVEEALLPNIYPNGVYVYALGCYGEMVELLKDFNISQRTKKITSIL